MADISSIPQAKLLMLLQWILDKIGLFDTSSRTNNRGSKDGYKFIIKINLRVEITGFTQFVEVQCKQTKQYNQLFRRIIPKYKYTDLILARCLG